MNEHPSQNHDLEDDDAPVGTVLGRRAALRLLGLAGGAAAVGGLALAGGAGRPPGPPPSGPGGPGGTPPASGSMGTSAGTSGAQSLPACIVRPAQTQGPYWVDEKLKRRDIRADTKTGKVPQGVPLTLHFDVSRIGLNQCEPRAGVIVDIWHCDALGVYSDANDQGYNTKGQNFLRGYQTTDAQGKCSFTTIFPGWYAGRAVHIHYRLRTLDSAGKVNGDFVSQLFFPEALIATVHAQAPYKQKGTRDTPNATDSIYKNGGNQMMLTTSGDVKTGIVGTFNVGLNVG